MMFSNEDIKRVLASGELKIEPLKPEWVRAAGVTLHLGAVLLKPIAGKVVDVKNGIIPDYEEIKISSTKPYTLNPGGFVLGATLQLVTVGNSIGFFIEGRSTLARVGLTIVQTAMMVYPGHRGRAVTLEIANHGPNPILLYGKMKIARAAVFELRTPTTLPYDVKGKYRIQGGVGAPIFDDEVME